jgi:hypothetical protein
MPTGFLYLWGDAPLAARFYAGHALAKLAHAQPLRTRRCEKPSATSELSPSMAEAAFI